MQSHSSSRWTRLTLNSTRASWLTSHPKSTRTSSTNSSRKKTRKLSVTKSYWAFSTALRTKHRTATVFTKPRRAPTDSRSRGGLCTSARKRLVFGQSTSGGTSTQKWQLAGRATKITPKGFSARTTWSPSSETRTQWWSKPSCRI